jgi:DNA-3-methyladenine glycosylase
MNVRRLPQSFYARPTLTVARDLLGKLLIRRTDGGMSSVRITEVEAYRGEDDLACHASRGRTPRTETLYARPGTAYVYLIYGMYHCLNVVTERADFPAAVLLRGAEPIDEELPSAAYHGPGRLCRSLNITRAENGLNLTRSRDLFFADDGARVPPHAVARTPRIGVEYAGAAAAWPWRFVHVEKPRESVRTRAGSVPP